MDRDKLQEILKQTFGLKELPEIVSQETIEQWDSLGHLQLIMAIERGMEIKFKMDRIPELTNLEKIEEEINGMA